MSCSEACRDVSLEAVCFGRLLRYRARRLSFHREGISVRSCRVHTGGERWNVHRIYRDRGHIYFYIWGAFVPIFDDI